MKKEDITDVSHKHAKRVFKNSRWLSKLCVRSDTLLLADAFENFRNKCSEIYELDPANFVSAPGLAWQTCLKKTGIK